MPIKIDELGHNVAINREGWFALQHRDGYFYGNSEGVLCYATEVLARAANTIIYHRNEGRLWFNVVTYTPAPICSGEVEHKHSVAQAFKRMRYHN